MNRELILNSELLVFGISELDNSKFNKIRNNQYYNRFCGGLKCYPTSDDSEFGSLFLEAAITCFNSWLDNLSSIKIKIKESSNILVVDSFSTLQSLLESYALDFPKKYSYLKGKFTPIDYENIGKDFDGVYIDTFGIQDDMDRSMFELKEKQFINSTLEHLGIPTLVLFNLDCIEESYNSNLDIKKIALDYFFKDSGSFNTQLMDLKNVENYLNKYHNVEVTSSGDIDFVNPEKGTVPIPVSCSYMGFKIPKILRPIVREIYNLTQDNPRLILGRLLSNIEDNLKVDCNDFDIFFDLLGLDCVKKGDTFYFKGSTELRLELVNINSPWIIKEYDGMETIVYLNDYKVVDRKINMFSTCEVSYDSLLEGPSYEEDEDDLI